MSTTIGLRRIAAAAAAAVVAMVAMIAGGLGCRPPSRAAEEQAVPSASHPLAGMWKDHCEDGFGLAISPAGANTYSISFCGPGGCFAPGTYRPDSTIVGDPAYRIIDERTIEVQTSEGFVRHVRCANVPPPSVSPGPAGESGG